MDPVVVSPPRGRGAGAGAGRGRNNRGGPHRGGGGGGGGRGKGRGRGGRQQSQESSAPASSTLLAGSSFGARLTGSENTLKASKGESVPSPGQEANNDTSAKSEPGKEADDAEVCFICASPIEHTAIMPCNHQTCHICALRLRALYKTRNCAHCRTEAPYVIFTDSAEKHFQDFEESDFVHTDENLGIKYDKDVIREDTLLLLRYNCPDKDCEVACYGWPDLYRHVKSKHGKVMCDLCTRNKKVFTHEHELFTPSELRRHEKYGDDNPGAVDQSGFKGHPECGFCRQRFYGDDELYHHCREKHERCHICDRRNGGARPEYYLNYQELEKHFAEAHFVCLDPECQANKTNVFDSEMDLKAHQLSEHPNSMSKDSRRDTALVNLSGFDVRTPYQPERSRRGGNGRGRDPNSEPLPMSSAQPLSRAELAYQRQMAIQSSQSVTPRTFGGQLTQPSRTAPARPKPSQPTQPSTSDSASASTSASTSAAAAADLSTDLANVTLSSSPRSQARLARHTAVTNRASNLLRHDTAKLNRFRTLISTYRASPSSSNSAAAASLLDGFFSLFDCPSAELGILIRELADLFEDADGPTSTSKRTELLKAWNDWRSINEAYPSLPLPQGGHPSPSSSGGGAGNKRVLKLKSSTQQSAQSRTARQSSWGHGLNSTINGMPSLSSSAALRPEAFPSLPASSSSSRKPHVTAGPGPGPGPASLSWTSSSRPPPSFSSSSSSSSFPSLSSAGRPNATTTTTTTTTAASTIGGSSSSSSSRSARKPPPRTQDLFPRLPAAPKPDVSIRGFNTRPLGPYARMTAGGAGGNKNNSSESAWGSASASASGSSTPTAAAAAAAAATTGDHDDDEDNATAKQSKGKGKKKAKGEILFHFG